MAGHDTEQYGINGQHGSTISDTACDTESSNTAPRPLSQHTPREQSPAYTFDSTTGHSSDTHTSTHHSSSGTHSNKKGDSSHQSTHHYSDSLHAATADSDGPVSADHNQTPHDIDSKQSQSCDSNQTQSCGHNAQSANLHSTSYSHSHSSSTDQNQTHGNHSTHSLPSKASSKRDSNVHSTSNNPSKVSLKRFSCIVCMSRKPVSDSSYLSSACKYNPHLTRKGKKYRVCRRCLKKYIQNVLKQSTDGSIPCMYGLSNCGCHASFEDLQRIFVNDPQALEECHTIINRRTLRSQDSFIECANPDCDYAEILPKECLNLKDTPWSCKLCAKDTCIKHRIPYHDGKTCAEYDEKNKDNEEATRQWINANTKKCSRCGMIIEKHGGCAEMRCRCENSFTWNDASSLSYYIGIPAILACLCCLGCSTCCFCCCCCGRCNVDDMDPRNAEDFRRWA